MSLYLSGGGHGTAHMLASFCKQIEPEQQVLFIPHARPQQDWLEMARSIKTELAPYGIRHFMLEADLRFIQAEPEDLGAVYIADGDLGLLHDQLMNPAFQAWLQRAYEIYLPIYVRGASAVLVGKDIRTTPATLDRPASHRKGMNWLGGASLSCPQTANQRPQARYFPLWALSPDSGLFLDPEGFRIMGTASAECWLADQQLVYEPGTQLAI